jgi:23S rRNA (cytosine1962-C5)-methyltransferase
MKTAYPTVALKDKHDAAARRRHPWIFSGAVARADGSAEDGGCVRVLSAAGDCLGVGHFQAGGSICVRMLAWQDRAVDATFWEERLRAAQGVRQALGLAGSAATNAYRLVHAEGDELPGLIIDWYNGHAAVQPHSGGMSRAVPEIRDALQTVCGSSLKAIHIVSTRSDAPTTDSVSAAPDPIEILQDGLRFRMDFRRGQKTGFYLDQRENRQLLARYAPGRRLLDLFSYSGGFSVYALKAGAQSAQAVDGSGQALEWARENVAINGLGSPRFTCTTADIMNFVKALPTEHDLIVCDPPAFAKRMSARHSAIQAYRRLNAEVMQRIAPGGILFTFSCSQVVTPDLFRGAVLAGALDAGRPVRILHQLHQPPDHPINLYHSEGEYLKGLVLHVG